MCLLLWLGCIIVENVLLLYCLYFNVIYICLYMNQAHYSTGAVAAGFTSTVLAPQTKHEAAIVEEDLVRYERVKKKGTYN